MALCSSMRGPSPNTRRPSWRPTPNRQRSEQIGPGPPLLHLERPEHAEPVVRERIGLCRNLAEHEVAPRGEGERHPDASTRNERTAASQRGRRRGALAPLLLPREEVLGGLAGLQSAGIELVWLLAFVLDQHDVVAGRPRARDIG